MLASSKELMSVYSKQKYSYVYRDLKQFEIITSVNFCLVCIIHIQMDLLPPGSVDQTKNKSHFKSCILHTKNEKKMSLK